MLEKLARHEYYYCLDRYSGYMQIPVASQDQEKTTFICPYETFAYKRMSFGLCNALATFQSVETMQGHQPSAKLGKMSIHGAGMHHVKTQSIHERDQGGPYQGGGFYRRFVKDFSKIAKLMTDLLAKDVEFEFSNARLNAFQLLKENFTNAPMVVAPDWTSPFELMCDTSDTVVEVVLGQGKDKVFHIIYYAIRTLNKAQQNYTTIENELLTIVFAFDKGRAGSKEGQEFGLETRDKKGIENRVADHLSYIDQSVMQPTDDG
ncbi:Retrovirus-related Pol polyprotein from transposon 17.6, partial [Mucuna pruriens]